MDKSKNRHYNIKKGKKCKNQEVIFLTPNVTAQQYGSKPFKPIDSLEKRPKSAVELRRKLSVKSALGKSLIDLYKEGK